MKNHKKTPQDCHLYSQTIFKKGLWPCVYCGVQLAHQNSQRLEKHIEHHHPQGRFYVCYIFVIWVTKSRYTFFSLWSISTHYLNCNAISLLKMFPLL